MKTVRIRRSCIAFSAVLITGAGCGGAGEDEELGSRVVQRDSVGVRVVESVAPAWSAGEGWTVNDAPVLDLAESGEGPVHEFFRATDAARLSDGSIVVADDGTDELRIFSPAGEHLRTLGRAGDGPGEFRRLSQVVVLPGDSILAYDYWQARITVFGPRGEMARIARVEDVYRPRPLFPLASGGYVGSSTDFTGFREEPGLHRLPSPIVRTGGDGTVLDTLTTVPGYESVVFSRGDGVAVWGRNAHLAVYGDHVYLGSADSLEYEVRSPGGELERIVRVPGYDLTLSSEEIEAERSEYMPDPAEVDEVTRELMEMQPEWTHRPAYSDMIVDVQGHVWLKKFQGRHERSEPTGWLIFDPQGQWLGAVTLPPRFEVFRIGEDWILGKRPDELDVEHIQVLGLGRGD